MAERTRLPDFFHDEEAFEGDDFDDGFGDADDRDPDEEDPGCMMSPDDRYALVELRRRGATRGDLSQEEQEFCRRMFDEHPDEYREIDLEIREWKQRIMNPLHDRGSR